MGITGKKKSSNSGMGFLFVFVPEEDNNSFRPFHSLLKRTNSSNLLQKAQSTISICVLLFFFTLLLFTLSTLPPTTPTPPRPHYFILPRRHFSATPKPSSSSSSISPRLSHALQGVGSLYRRGTSSMSDLIVAHAVESLTCYELKLFLRLLYRSSLSSRSDLAFIFPSKSAAFDNIILEENDAFLKLATQYGKLNHSTQLMASFDVAQFVKSRKKGNETGEPIWGRRIRSNSSEKMETESKRLSYGSVVGFDVQELDPDNSLAGFFDPDNSLTMSLRRWACYPMLLGRVRRNFKHILLVDIKEILLSGDPLGRVRNQTPESVSLTTLTQSMTTRHGRKTRSTHQKLANPAIIMGGARGTRRLSNAMLTQIVRAAMQHKKKNSLSELGLFNQLVGNEFILKNVNLITSIESIPELSSLTGLNFKPGSYWSINHTLIRRGNIIIKDANYVVTKLLCLFPLNSTINSNC